MLRGSTRAIFVSFAGLLLRRSHSFSAREDSRSLCSPEAERYSAVVRSGPACLACNRAVAEEDARLISMHPEVTQKPRTSSMRRVEASSPDDSID